MKNILLSNDHHINQSGNPWVNYVRQGSGRPVILTHGLAASLHDWDDLLPELEAAGFAGYAHDLLGHGESYKPDDHREYTLDNVFTQFSKWIDTLQLYEPMTLIGHSLGGGLSLMYALRHPERVNGLILINPLYGIEQLPPMLRTLFRHQLVNTYLIEHTPYRLFRMLVDMTNLNVYIGHRESHILPEHVRYQTALDYKRASPGIYNIPRTLPDLTPDLQGIRQPVLLIYGKRDQTLSSESFPRLAGLLPNLVASHSMPICGHVPHQCHAQKLNPIVLDFLKNLVTNQVCI